MNKSTDNNTINLVGYLTTCKARKAWQLMFNLYLAGGGDLNNLDNMLCDFNHLQKIYESELKVVYDKAEFYFCFDKNYEQTLWEDREENLNYMVDSFDYVYKFTLTDEEVSYITIKNGETNANTD